MEHQKTTWKKINNNWHFLSLMIAFYHFMGICHSEIVIYNTSATHCEISFTQEQLENRTDFVLKFSQCKMEVCRKYNLQGGCRNSDLFYLNENKCYWECCHSDSFDFNDCQQYNSKFEESKKSSNKTIAIVLGIIIFCLSLIVIVFLVKYIKCCCRKGADYESEDEIQSNCAKSQNRAELYWKDEEKELDLEKKCHFCEQKQAFIMHSCGRMFHLKCLVELGDKWECPHCLKNVKKLRIYCIVCLNRSVTMRVSSFEDLEEKLNKSYQVHPDPDCVQFMAVQLDTERKLTETTKS